MGRLMRRCAAGWRALRSLYWFKLLAQVVGIWGLLIYGYFLVSAGLSIDGRSVVYAKIVNNALIPVDHHESYRISSMGYTFGTSGCNQFALENCAGLSAPVAVIENPVVFGKVVDAIRHPCRYLVDPDAKIEATDSLGEKWKTSPNQANRDWEYLKCATGGTSSTKVVLNIRSPSVYNKRGFVEEREIYLRIIKPSRR